MGPRRKRWADDPVKLLDPVSAAVWLGRLDRFEMMVRGPGTSAALFIGAEAGLSKDSFFPCAGSIIDLKADLAILDAIVGTEQNSMGQSASDMDYWVRGGFFAQKAKVGRAWAKLWGKQDDASEATRQIEAHDQGTADRLRAARNRAMIPRVVDLLAAGFTRPERPVPLKATLAASFPGTSQVRGGYQGADPKIEPDLVWLVRAMSAGDGSPLAGGLARPLAQLDGTELAKFVKGLVENEKVVAITWDPPPDATEASRFARLGPGSSQKMRSLFTYGRVKYKPTDPSQRVVAEAASRGWQADWYDDWSRSVAAQAPTTDGDRATYDFLQMDDKLEKQLAKLTDDVGYVFFDSATVEGLKLPDGAAPAPVAKAIAEAAGLNFSMIARFEPPDKVADAKKSYLEASILQDLKAGNQLLSEYWKAQAADSDAALSGSRWKEDLRALVRATGAKATLVKSQGDPEVLQ
ncbi:MAG: hypothetical protein HY815_17260 [Candidatus Riflebacteria bacterium]|nr:hypothetical protein [Candidatus Riflebacteria bacterium]